jgi:hypothetical protein
MLTATSRRRALFTWSCITGKACRSSSRSSLARRPVHGRMTASPTNFPLEELVSVPTTTSLCLARQVSASHHKYLPRTTSLRLARQVWLRLVRGAQPHNLGVTTDVREGADLHVMRKQQLAAMQATCPDKSLNAGLTSHATITLPSPSTLPHATRNLRHLSTLYDAHEPRLRLGRGKLGKHSGRLRQAQTTRGEGQASRREQSNPAARRFPRQGIATRLQYTPTDGDVRRDVPTAKHCNSFLLPLVPLPLRL